MTGAVTSCNGMESKKTVPDVISAINFVGSNVARLYNPKGDAKEIQALRCSPFRKVGKKPENMPPTEDALHQHILRAHHQSLVWRNANVPNPGIPNPTTSGWYLEHNQLMFRLMTKEGFTAECVNIATCACSKGPPCLLTGRCKCRKNGLRCSLACKCADLCRTPSMTLIVIR